MVKLILANGSFATTPRLPGKLSATVLAYQKAHKVRVVGANAPRVRVIA